jgi:ribosome biogenesis GTPase
LINLFDYGFTEAMASQHNINLAARVSAVMRERYELITANGHEWGRLKGAAYFDAGPDIYPTVGDFVEVMDESATTGGDRLIVGTFPRFSKFIRRASGTRRQGYLKAEHEQTIAANFNVCFIVTSANHDLNMARLERYLSQAWSSGAVPVIMLTKADLVDDYEAITYRISQAFAGVSVTAVSVVTGMGLDEMKDTLRPGHTAVLLGSSGVGKSSLVNALSGGDLMKVNAIREDDSRGRHTTTHRQLITLPWGAMIIDTPGMREMGLWDADEGVSMTFADVEAVVSRGCRFSNCKHQGEPGCAVREAIDSGELSKERYESYVSLQSETKYMTNKVEFLRERQRRHKEIAKFSKNLKRLRDAYPST